MSEGFLNPLPSMYGFIGGKRKIWKPVLRLVLGVSVCLFLSILGLLKSIGFREAPFGASFHVFAETSAEVVINEVEYNGAQPEGESGSYEWKYEWIELFNGRSASVDIEGWYLKDKYYDEQGKTTPLPSFEIPTGDFLVVAATEEGFRANHSDFSGSNIIFLEGKIGNGLANSGDCLVLGNSEDNEVSSLSWGSNTLYNTGLSADEGNSLERIPFGTGDFTDQDEPTPGVGVESGEDTEETEDPNDQGESEGENGGDGMEEIEEAELAVSFSAPSEVILGEEFEVEVNLENAVSGRNYLVKFGANDGTLDYGQFSKGYTWSDSLDKFLPFSGGGYSWDDFPSIGGSGGTIKARITSSALAGDCAVMVRVRDAEESENYDSEVKMIRANEAPEEVEEEDDDDESSDVNQSDGSEEEGGEVLGEQATTKRSAKKTSSSESYALGPFGKDTSQATASPILSASSSADHEASPSSESALSDFSNEESPSKLPIVSKILLALGGITILGVFGFAIAKKRGLV